MRTTLVAQLSGLTGPQYGAVMGGSRLKTIAVQIGMLGVLTIVVVALTFLFNLVGTLCFSIVVGMMAGAARRCNWQIIFISLMPPIVALVLGYLTKVDFDLQRGLYLAGICLGSFWGTWLATYLLMFLEAKSDSAPATPSTTTPPRANELNGEFKPEDLHGTWLCETNAGETSKRKTLIVEHGKFSLRITAADGSARIVAQGEMVLRAAEAKRKPFLDAASEDSDARSG